MTDGRCNHFIVEDDGEWRFAGVATRDDNLLLCAMCGQRFKPRGMEESRIIFRARVAEAGEALYNALPRFIRRWLV